MAMLVPPEMVSRQNHLGDIQGWLDDDDPFFEEIGRIVADRGKHRPRVLDS